MSQGESKRLETECRFALAVTGGQPRNRLAWHTGRVLVTTSRLVFSSDDRQRMVELDDITAIGGPATAGHTATGARSCVSVHIDDTIVLFEPDDRPAFEEALVGAVLNGFTVTVRRPAPDGGGTRWVEGHLAVKATAVAIALGSGERIILELAAVTAVSSVRSADVDGAEWMLTVEHLDDGRPVETAVAGSQRHLRLLGTYLEEHHDDVDDGVTLGEHERRVLRALDGGVSPFGLTEALDLSPAAVETAIDRLLDDGFIEVIRVRREVALTDQGRRVAGRLDTE